MASNGFVIVLTTLAVFATVGIDIAEARFRISLPKISMPRISYGSRSTNVLSHSNPPYGYPKQTWTPTYQHGQQTRENFLSQTGTHLYK